VDFAALLALLAALISGVGDVVRQRSAHEITDEEVGHVELLCMSLGDTRWWLGGVAAVASAALQHWRWDWGRWCWCRRCR
jgi:Na+-transporting methylmalonyl-CoA/oxaloacetate decarboxylase gamma subunit